MDIEQRFFGKERPLARLIFLATLVFAVVTSSTEAAESGWKPAPAPLMTKWAKEVDPRNPLPEYPRPQMTRSDWLTLNGLWDRALTPTNGTPPTKYSGQILVPYPYESALSGVGGKSIPDQLLWYRRTFKLPSGWKGQKVLLHLGAVNYESAVFVNGKKVGDHRGGYDGFTFDITSELKTGENEIVVSASNPVTVGGTDPQVVGKQRLQPRSIFYTAATGIWQSVWLEPVPVNYIESLKLTPEVDYANLRLLVQAQGQEKFDVYAEVRDGSEFVGSAQGIAGEDVAVALTKTPHLWTPSDPHLYTVRVKLQHNGKTVDTVDGYFAMRKVSLGKDNKGRLQILLNNEFLLEMGALDQGYWPDGIYTAPTDAALRSDIATAKELGWNLLRKHAKVEPARWYYWADKLGMLVWQDMPQMFPGREKELSDAAKQQFDTEWQRIITEFYNSPSIIVWTTFNEGWGQHDTARVVALTKQWDPTRLVNNASGWTDEKAGDMYDTHAYPGPKSENPEEHRAAVNGEFGGVTLSIPEHRWNAQTMGYGAVLKENWVATKHYQDLLKAAYRIAFEQGTSAFVYTQITDVEQEINGLLTYDRAMIKLDKDIVAAANKGKFLPLPPNPHPELVPTSADEPASWRYTTNQPAAGWEAASFVDDAWLTGNAVFGHNVANVRTPWESSDIWIRRQFSLPKKIPAKLVLLVQHDEDAEIYLNGVLAGKVSGFAGEYVSIAITDAARATLKSGANTMAAHCHNTVGGQGIDVGIIEAAK